MPKKNNDAPFFRTKSILLRIVLLFLASIGDGVIYCSIHSIFFARKGLITLQKKCARTVLDFQLFLQVFLQTAQRYIKSVHTTTRQHLAQKPQQFVKTIKTIQIPHFPQIRLRFPHFSIRIPVPAIPKSLLTFFLGVATTFLFAFIPYHLYLFVKYLPNPHLLSNRFIPVTTQIFDRNDVLLYEIHGDEDRTPIPLSKIPQLVKQATIAIEDKQFYKHAGFSFAGILRAARETLLNKQIQGGSTITQQLVKNSVLTSTISIERKLKEIAIAFWAERIYTKDQILEMYLNQVPYGGTTWGIEAASLRYFEKSVESLNLAEAAYLAGLPAAPTLYSPYGARPELARVRQHEVLRRMVEDGYISEAQANEARETFLTVKPYVVNIKAPHFVMYVKNLLVKKYGARLVDQGGLRVKTTLDLTTQEKAQQIISTQIAQLRPLLVKNGAALVSNPKNGDVLAMVGSVDYFDQENDGNVNVTLMMRQPGSSIKPITYATGLENGLTAMSFIEDNAVTYPIAGQNAYSPVNYDGRFHGRVTIRTALANSYNIPAVKIMDRIGVKTMIAMGKRMGITSWNDESRFGLSLTLGGGEVRMLDMNTVYGVFANYGNRVDLDPILEITDYTGTVYYKKEVKPKSVLSSEIAFIMSDILADNSARTAAFGPNSQLKISGKTVSVKTGTTDSKRDNWTIGYTPSYVVSVWVGNNDNTPMHPQLTSGVTGAAPIWNALMSELLKDKPDEKLAPNANIISLECGGRREYFIKGTEPKNGCPHFPIPTSNTNTLTAN